MNNLAVNHESRDQLPRYALDAADRRPRARPARSGDRVWEEGLPATARSAALVLLGQWDAGARARRSGFGRSRLSTSVSMQTVQLAIVGVRAGETSTGRGAGSRAHVKRLKAGGRPRRRGFAYALGRGARYGGRRGGRGEALGPRPSPESRSRRRARSTTYLTGEAVRWSRPSRRRSRSAGTRRARDEGAPSASIEAPPARGPAAAARRPRPPLPLEADRRRGRLPRRQRRPLRELELPVLARGHAARAPRGGRRGAPPPRPRGRRSNALARRRGSNVQSSAPSR